MSAVGRQLPKVRIGDVILVYPWLVFVCGVCAVSVWMLVRGEHLVTHPPPDAGDWLTPNELAGAPPFYDPRYLWVARGLIGTGVLATAFIVIACLSTAVSRRPNRAAVASLYTAVPLGLLPTATRLALPWENPWSGAGSPVLVLLSIPVYIAIFGIPVAWGAFFFLRNMTPHAAALDEVGGTDDATPLTTRLDHV